ncbi:hypothetical protein N7527_006508 [Penicillium freii]|nr:hypothetical protein N7527_006508 [Penicillium freii]
MPSLSQHLVKIASARHSSFLFRIFSLFPRVSLSLHRDYFSAYRLFSSLLCASLVCHFCSPSYSYRPSTRNLPATLLFHGLIVSFLSFRTLAVPSTSPNSTIKQREVSFDPRELYKDPLDKGRVNLSEIPEDFDKAPGTIERLERIESRASPRRRYARRRIIIYIVSYASVSSSSEARIKNLRYYYQKLTKIVIKDKDSLEIRREFSLDTQPRKKTPVYIEDIGLTTFILPEIVYGPSLVKEYPKLEEARRNLGNIRAQYEET